MSIEVRQLLVKSTVLQRDEAPDSGDTCRSPQEVDEIKRDVLAACRHLFIELLHKEGER